jgi:hypothetical protein
VYGNYVPNSHSGFLFARAIVPSVPAVCVLKLCCIEADDADDAKPATRLRRLFFLLFKGTFTEWIVYGNYMPNSH